MRTTAAPPSEGGTRMRMVRAGLTRERLLDAVVIAFHSTGERLGAGLFAAAPAPLVGKCRLPLSACPTRLLSGSRAASVFRGLREVPSCQRAGLTGHIEVYRICVIMQMHYRLFPRFF